ncbi:MAG: alpha/beta hydrolase [Gammaproteobacteria bacterium]|nr:alpha/beta hydrolase [Gammaproteobacteria bacterium]
MVLVHGLYLRGYAMWPLGKRLEQRGFACDAYSYPSFADSVADNAAGLSAFVDGIDAATVHFVGHSLGGIVIRHLLTDFGYARPGRVVTLGTPHRYSYVARTFAAHGALRWMLGKCYQGGLDGHPPPWPAGRELGSIAGDVGVGLGQIVPGLPSPNDGTVSVDETRVDGYGEHLVLPVTHSSMLLSARVADEVAAFLQSGRFSDDAKRGAE